MPRCSQMGLRCIGAPVLALLSAGVTNLATAQSPAFDIVIQGGRVVDGTGSPWFMADVGIRGDTIVAVSHHLDVAGAKTLDARGSVVAPGFIDVHSHSELSSAGPGIVAVPLAENNIRQGVTTVFANPDGRGEVPMRPFLDRVANARPTINVGSFIGHGSVRAKVIGLSKRPATATEMDQMRELVRTGMLDGAFGLSTGLFYAPASYAPLDEIVSLARVIARYGGIHQSHMRDEAAGILDAVRETIAIGENGGLPTQISHHKIVGKSNWGKSVETLRLVDEARARGVDVTIDQYPYTASSTTIIRGLLPQWAQEGGQERLIERLRDSEIGKRVRAEIAKALEAERGGGDPDNVVLASCAWDKGFAGKSLGQVLRDRRRPVTIQQATALVIEIVQNGDCVAVYHAIGEEDLMRILKHPATMIASDAFPGEPEFGKDVPHPRAYGTFARVLGVYVRDKHALTLEEAIRKMSSFPAQRMGLVDRGLIRPGMKADVVVFDPARVRDLATFEKPHQYAQGFSHVIVNGEIVLETGEMTRARSGRVLFGPAVAKPAAGN
jgi:N-acyl-D-amino-acid deacylase